MTQPEREGVRRWTISGPRQVQQEDGTWIYVNRPVDPPLDEGEAVEVIEAAPVEELVEAARRVVNEDRLLAAATRLDLALAPFTEDTDHAGH